MTEAQQRVYTEPPPRPAQPAPPAARRRPRSARLVLHRFEPLSVLKFAAVVSLAGMVVVVVTVAALYSLLDVMGVFTSVGMFTRDIGATKSPHFSSLGIVLAWTALVSAGFAIFATAAATVAAFVFNLVTDVVGGPEFTLTERR